MSGPIFACLTQHPVSLKSNAPSGAKLEFQKGRAAFLKGVEWNQGQTIRIAFLKSPFSFQGKTLDPQYTREKADFVRRVITSDIAPLVNLKFEWDVDISTSDVRIMFVPRLGAWSYLGTQSKSIAKNQPTMNLGWIDDDTNFDGIQYKGTGVVVIHEFGHMLGMIHEHSRADAKLDWNKPVIYRELAKPPNEWSRDDVDKQVFETYDVDSFNGSAYDTSSVMHYIFPPEWFLTNPRLPIVTHLSPLDKQWISKTYPRSGEPDTGSSEDGGISSDYPPPDTGRGCRDGSMCYGAYCDNGDYCGGREGFMGMNLSNDSGMCTWKKIAILALILAFLYYLLKKTKSRK
jgi:serralysin